MTDDADAFETKEDQENHERWLVKEDADWREMVKQQEERTFVREANWRRQIGEIEKIARNEMGQLTR